MARATRRPHRRPDTVAPCTCRKRRGPTPRAAPCCASRSARASSTARTCRWRPTRSSPRRSPPGSPRRRPRTVVGPSLTVTASGEHAGFPGTLSIGTEATAARDRRARPLRRLGGRRRARQRPRRQPRRRRAGRSRVLDARGPSRARRGGHACPVATPTPGAPRRRCCWRCGPTSCASTAPRRARPRRSPRSPTACARAASAPSPPTVCSAIPTGASAAEGAAILAGLVDDLVAAVVDWLLAPSGVRR